MESLTAQSSVPFAPPFISAAAIEEVVATLRSGWLTTGPRVQAFEQHFAEYTGAAHAVAVSSCTAALHLSLLAGGIGAGDEVVTTPLTFCATANAVIQAGATPVFADIDPVTMNLDPASAARAITACTRALLPVHFAGRPADVDRLRALADQHSAFLIEDAAHCIEGAIGDRKIGTTGDFTCFSFYSTKNLTTGEGGMITTESAERAAYMQAAALHGLSRGAWARYGATNVWEYEVKLHGFKYNMMDLQAAIGLHQLADLDTRLARRATLWTLYDEALIDLPVRLPPPVPADIRHARHLYTILIDQAQCGRSRDQVREGLAARGISTSVHFRSLHLHPYYAERFNLRRGMFPNAEFVSDRTLSLPLSPVLSTQDIERVVEALRAELRVDR